ncbi:NAD-binding protein [Pseudomonas aeruginosa]|nr:NAD-binding protein [Pseudomonas aeruginosa]
MFAARNGADPAKVREALMGGFASSRILEVHGERMVKGTFDPGFRISLHQKDSKPGPGRRPRAEPEPAQHRQRPAGVQHLRGHRRQ